MECGGDTGGVWWSVVAGVVSQAPCSINFIDLILLIHYGRETLVGGESGGVPQGRGVVGAPVGRVVWYPGGGSWWW